jgi:hypothetical protein
MPMPQMQSSEPMQQMFAAPMAQGPAYMTPIPGQLVMPDAQQQQQMMGFPPPPPRMATEGGAVYFHETGPFQAPRDSTSMLELGRRRRLLVIAISVALGIVLLVKLGGKKHADEPPLDEHAVVPLTKTADAAASAPPMAPGDAAVAVAIPVDGTPEVQPAIPDAAATFVMAADAAVEPAGCSVEVTTTPAGAEIAIDNHTVIGTSPGSFPLPCGAVTKLYIRKPTYSGVIWPVTPTAEGAKVRVTLVKPATTLQVKVSSSPAGATITANGKSMGTTPTVIKLPAFEAVTIVIAKEGYVSETQKITPKADRQAVHAQLKRAPKRH